MLRITFECFEYGFERFESLSNCSNLDSNASNPFQMFRISIRMLQIPFEWFKFWIRMLRITFKWFKFPFECLESLSNASNFLSNFSNPFQMVQICIQMNGISFEVFEKDSNASNPFRMDRIWIRMFPIIFELFEFPIECFESLSIGSNFHSNA